MTKRSQYEQAQRAAENQRMREVGDAWNARISPQVATEFKAAVERAQSRPPLVRVDMAPGTLPNPPRPGREPKERDDRNARRRS
jgi:hypothetical protein